MSKPYAHFANETYRRRRLPHWDVEGAIYFVTCCLQGSMPAQGILDIEQYRRQLVRSTTLNDLPPDEQKHRRWKLQFARSENWLDSKPGCRHLADARLAQRVVDGFFYFAALRYDLLAFVVMPSHFHWVFRPLEDWTSRVRQEGEKRTPREIIIHSLKRHTARQCNQLLERQGRF